MRAGSSLVALSAAVLLLTALARPHVATAQRQPRTTIELVGRLTAVSAGPDFDCGVLGWAVAARYEVVRTLFGRSPGRVIFALSSCGPPMGSTLGALETLELTPIGVGHLEVFDDFVTETGPRLWLVRSRPAAP